MMKKDLKTFLDDLADRFENPDFIPDDPISIPHLFSKKQDIEISGFLSATIAWGNRKSILTSADRILKIMDHAPHDFVLHHKDSDLRRCRGFVHRTFNAEDLQYFLSALQHIYQQFDDLEGAFTADFDGENIHTAIQSFRSAFFGIYPPGRTAKHVSDPYSGSSAKRLNMFLRWMVRPEKKGVDFGIWKQIQPRHLMMPLDVHTSTSARHLGLLERKQNDWKAVEELMLHLRKLNTTDPVRYDFALFAMGVHKIKSPGKTGARIRHSDQKQY